MRGRQKRAINDRQVIHVWVSPVKNKNLTISSGRAKNKSNHTPTPQGRSDITDWGAILAAFIPSRFFCCCWPFSSYRCPWVAPWRTKLNFKIQHVTSVSEWIDSFTKKKIALSAKFCQTCSKKNEIKKYLWRRELFLARSLGRKGDLWSKVILR